MKIEIDFKVTIEVEDDKTCSVMAPSMFSIHEGPGRGKIRGLSPEQATALKIALEDAHRLGYGRGIEKVRDHASELLNRPIF
jgi:hypothetical protein